MDSLGPPALHIHTLWVLYFPCAQNLSMLIGWHVWFSNGELAVLYCHFTLLVMLQFFGFAMWHWGVLAKDVLWHWIAFQLFTCPCTIWMALVCMSILGCCWWFFCLVRTLWAYPWQDFVATCLLPKVRSWVFPWSLRPYCTAPAY